VFNLAVGHGLGIFDNAGVLAFGLGHKHWRIEVEIEVPVSSWGPCEEYDEPPPKRITIRISVRFGGAWVNKVYRIDSSVIAKVVAKIMSARAKKKSLVRVGVKKL